MFSVSLPHPPLEKASKWSQSWILDENIHWIAIVLDVRGMNCFQHLGFQMFNSSHIDGTGLVSSEYIKHHVVSHTLSHGPSVYQYHIGLLSLWLYLHALSSSIYALFTFWIGLLLFPTGAILELFPSWVFSLVVFNFFWRQKWRFSV